MFCSDPFVSFLKAQGYCAVRVPRADLRPLELLTAQGGALDRLGRLEQVLVGEDLEPPAVSRAMPVPSLSGRRTGSLRAGIGLSLLGDALKAMGVGGPAIDLSVRPGTTMTLALDGVTEDRVDVAALDRYLDAAEVLPGSPSVAALLDADDVYVITAVVRARRLLVNVEGSDGHAAELAAPDLTGVVEAHVSVAVDREHGAALTYLGRVPLAFGFKAVRLLYEHGRYTALRSVAPGRVMRGGEGAAPEADALEVAGPFARLR